MSANSYYHILADGCEGIAKKKAMFSDDCAVNDDEVDGSIKKLNIK